MNVEHQVQQLESLLARIRSNAASLAATRGQAPTVEATASSQPPSSAIEVGEDDFATIPPAAPSKPSSPPPEIRSGLHNLMDLGSGERAAPSRPGEALESASVPPPAADARESSPPDDETYPVSVEEVTGERPAFGASEPAHAPAVRTPPPESGPQAAPPPQAAYDTGPELSLSDAPLPSASQGPTIEQLGSTVELDAGTGPLELHVEVPSGSAGAATDDEFEATIPSRRFAGTYDDSLAPPPSALAELDAHDRAERERAGRRSSMPPREAYSQPLAAAMVPPGPEGPMVWERPPVLASISAAIYEREFGRSLVPKTFIELLDASLELRKP